jgi:hypothetical protein
MRELSIFPIAFGLLLLICLPLFVADYDHQNKVECVDIPTKRIANTQLYGQACSDGTEKGFEGMPDSIYIERVLPVKNLLQASQSTD